MTHLPLPAVCKRCFHCRMSFSQRFSLTSNTEVSENIKPTKLISRLVKKKKKKSSQTKSAGFLKSHCKRYSVSTDNLLGALEFRVSYGLNLASPEISPAPHLGTRPLSAHVPFAVTAAQGLLVWAWPQPH